MSRRLDRADDAREPLRAAAAAGLGRRSGTIWQGLEETLAHGESSTPCGEGSKSEFLGQTIGHYRILEFVGRGGMGEVYRASDLRLKREVAIKFLLSDLARSPDFRRRIAIEAEAIANCLHPSICTIHDVSAHEGRPYLVLEYLQGRTLDALLQEGPPTVDEVLTWGVQIAGALARAHERQLIHRDIKPSNIFICGSGLAKLLDFGVVLSPASLLACSQAIESREERYLTGSAFYLSPEQCALQALKPSSDVFSFGVVLYEMLGGRRPFDAGTLSQLRSTIQGREPTPLRLLCPSIDPALELLVAKALRKNSNERYQDGAEILADLEQIVSDRRTAPLQIRLTTSRAALRRVLIASALTLLLLIAGFTLFLRFRFDAPISLTEVWSSDMQGENTSPAIASNGKQVVFTSNRGGHFGVYLQNVGSDGNAVLLSKSTPGDSTEPALSADGKKVAFVSHTETGKEGIFVIDVSGRHLRQLTMFGHQPSWSPDGNQIVFTTEALRDPERRVNSHSEMYIADVETGAVHSVYGGDAMQAKWSPNGARLAFVSGSTGVRRIATIKSSGGDLVFLSPVGISNWSPAWSADGQYLYFCSDRDQIMNIWRVRLDPHTGRRRQEPEALTVPADYVGQLSLSADGRFLACMRDSSRTTIYRVGLSPVGSLSGEPVPLRISSHHELNVGISASPDGRYIAYASDRHGERLFIAHADGSDTRELIRGVESKDSKNRVPRWSPDGRTIAFQSSRSGKWEIWRVDTDGSHLQQLTHTVGEAVNPVWSPDGHALAFTVLAKGASQQVLSFSNGSISNRGVDCHVPKGEMFIAKSWSPDSQWLAGSLHRRDGRSIGVALEDVVSGELRQLTNDGGEAPVFSQDGGHLFYRLGSSVNMLDVATRQSLVVLPSTRFQVFDSISFASRGAWLYFTDLQRQSDVMVLRIGG